jgi:sphingosine kinase
VLSYKFESSLQEAAENWVAKLLERSYGQAQKQKRAKILVNPFSGKGGAVNIYDREIAPILAAARCHIDVVHTKSGAEASEIAEKIDIEAFDTIISCSGDGLPHLVFNGLGKRPDAKRALEKIAVVQLPCGSGNAMSWNLNGTNSPSLATLAVIKGISIPLDLMSITQGNTRTLSFLSQSVGIVAESDLATEHLRWMGEARFTYGFLVRLLGKTVYPCDIAIKVESEDKASIKALYEEEKTSQLPASERRGNKPLLDDDESGLSGNELGLPPLRFGTVNDKLPEGMQLVPYDTIGNFYCGNVCLFFDLCG